jgi:hypothetical protein
MKKMLGYILLFWFTAACDSTDNSKTFPAYYMGSYSFSSVESMAIGVWLLPDSTFLLLKKVDNDTLFHGVFGNWTRTDDIFHLNSGDAGRLVVKLIGNNLEVLNSEGGQIGREPKFILSEEVKSEKIKLIFSAEAKVITVDKLPKLRFCNSNKYWDISNERAELSGIFKDAGSTELNSEVIVELEAGLIESDQIHIIKVQRQSLWINCDN